MDEFDSHCLDTLQEWLRCLNSDALTLAGLADNEHLPISVRRQATGAVNYLVKSLDLIPEGLEDLGYTDDAFVFRTAAAAAVQLDASAAEIDTSGTLDRLARDADVISELLEDDYARLAALVRSLDATAVRGRSVEAIISDEVVRYELLQDVKSWSQSYDAPSLTRDEKTLVKLRSFMHAKLPE